MTHEEMLARARQVFDVEVKGLDPESHQGDRAVVRLLREVREFDPKTSAPIDVSQTPDLYPALAAYGSSLGSGAVFTGTKRLRLKESDRILSTAAMIDAVNHGEPVNPCNDHRIAMAAAIMACRSRIPVVIENAECVAKSYPGFWTDFDSLSV